MNKLKELFTMTKYGGLDLSELDFHTNAHYDGNSWTIEYYLNELDISPKHIHASSLNDGIKQIVQDILEHSIWKLDE